MFRGSYHGKTRHPDDLAAVVNRANKAGVTRQILTGTNLHESKLVLELAKEYSELNLFCRSSYHRPPVDCRMPPYLDHGD